MIEHGAGGMHPGYSNTSLLADVQPTQWHVGLPPRSKELITPHPRCCSFGRRP